MIYLLQKEKSSKELNLFFLRLRFKKDDKRITGGMFSILPILVKKSFKGFSVPKYFVKTKFLRNLNLTYFLMKLMPKVACQAKFT